MCVCMCARSGPWQPWEWAALTSSQERTHFEREGELTAPRGHNFRLSHSIHTGTMLSLVSQTRTAHRGVLELYISVSFTGQALLCSLVRAQTLRALQQSEHHPSTSLASPSLPIRVSDQHCGLMFFPLTAFPCLLIPCRLFHQKFLGLLILSWHRLPGEFTLTQWVSSSQLIFFCISKRRRKFG